jgi:hypothetical protein
MSRRSFVRSKGKTRIKTEHDVSIQFGNERYESANPKSANQFLIDRKILDETGACGFIRPYFPGEFEGMALVYDLDMEAIKYVYVIDFPSPEHMVEHLRALAGQRGHASIEKWDNKPVHARVLLTEEQLVLIRMDIGCKHESFFRMSNGKIERL